MPWKCGLTTMEALDEFHMLWIVKIRIWCIEYSFHLRISLNNRKNKSFLLFCFIFFRLFEEIVVSLRLDKLVDCI